MSDPVKTPMMKQYLAMKKQYPDSVLLFRMGDFYETFLDDAKEVASILGITLTSRQKNRETGEGIPLAGFPYHALDGYLTRLIRAGCRVAVCEQTEDPKMAKGLVKRDVVEIVTPGTLVSGSALDERFTALLASVSVIGSRAAVVFCDVSTGDIRAIELPSDQVAAELARGFPREVIVSSDTDITIPDGCEVTFLDSWKFDPGTGEREVTHTFGRASSEGFGISDSPVLLSAMGALLSYIGHTKRSSVSHLEFRGVYRQNDYMLVDRSSSRSLGITDCSPGEENTVLADRTDRTVTAGGGRMWRQWLSFPPMNTTVTGNRHAALEDLIATGIYRDLQRILQGVSDLQRHGGKLGTLRSGPRDLRSIQQTAILIEPVKELLSGCVSVLLQDLAQMDSLSDIAHRIDATLSDDPPARVSDGGYIRQGYSSELDSLRYVKTGGKQWMNEMLEQERARTGITKLSIGYNRVFGYYLSVSNSFKHLVPDDYIRKQTLVGAERFITPELKEMEEKILHADEEISVLEGKIFGELLAAVASAVGRIKEAGRVLSELDILCSLAFTAVEKGWVRPELSDEPVLEISEGRHPVLEDILPRGECVPNDIELNRNKRILLVTGPNMAGKSTYLRQAALLVILAQCGSFVPAESMKFSPVDRIYTRIGSGDRLSRGQSTFLVEMAEAASLLNGSTENSLAILDEVGRGTSTYDGLSIAWAMLEYLHDNRDHRPMVLFATHYHELTSLAARLPLCANANTVVKETGNKIAFLYKVEEGAADRSYGIHVAAMAGVPSSVLNRAKKVLRDLEAGKHLLPSGSSDETGQMTLPLANPEHPVLEEIRKMDPDSLTPLKSLELIYLLKKQLDN
ncbi:MAG: DNA mismatch repair protein MutS [Candidatus Fermentibacteraceae bacterium]|nr:DNA mismatch repair protein MutS [Candidatus Fermentibacteraceae bacterium]